ncbi:hypothetical protein ACFFSY_20435 [Paenibacillus aurantiacus]|uniref:Uncharacterized protein n=1 Tax=Paenibacillus aurantiacus TaxID=1936118 RepID=A0ABV5KSU1_9BACL
MDRPNEKAYTYLFYCVLLDIRSASYPHGVKWWNPVSWVQARKDRAEINTLADLFHNLPDLLVNRPDDFDEAWFWMRLRERMPGKYEVYHRIFNEKLKES